MLQNWPLSCQITLVYQTAYSSLLGSFSRFPKFFPFLTTPTSKLLISLGLISSIRLPPTLVFMTALRRHQTGPSAFMAQTVKNLPAMQETGFNPWVGKIPWIREWQPTSVFLLGEFHGQRSLVGYSSQSHKESDWLSDEHIHKFSPLCIFKVSLKSEMFLEMDSLINGWSVLGSIRPVFKQSPRN